MDASRRELWGGLDWADEEHHVCLVDAQGEVVEAFAVAHHADGLDELVRRLRRAGPLAGVAIETPRHMVVYKLLAEGFIVYPVNPQTSHQWCKALSVAGATHDPSQAFALADGLRQRQAHLQPLLPDDPHTRELALLCEAEVDFIAKHTALVNQLQAHLKAFYPTALEWFEDWTRPSAWDFVVAFPTPQALAQATERTLYAFLKRHHIGASPRWQQKVAARGEATRWATDPALVAAYPLRVQGLVALLRTLADQLKELRRRIEALFDEHPDGALFASLPGAGPKLAPRLLTHFGSQRGRYDSARALQQLAGCVPVTKKSGKTTKVHFRHACRKSFRTTVHQFAFASLAQSAWARACYDMARERGASHAHALRIVGARWIGIIYRMWTTGTPYNEAIYLASLIRHGSPIIAWMQSQRKPSHSQKNA